jgi:hypothetical protein
MIENSDVSQIIELFDTLKVSTNNAIISNANQYVMTQMHFVLKVLHYYYYKDLSN